MPTDEEITPVVETETEVVTPPEGETTPVEEEKPALTPEQLQAELADVRREAANYRTRLRDAEAKLADAKTPDDIEAAVTEFREANARLEREILVTKVSGKYALPAELAARLQGADEAALDADAKALAALITSPKSTPESLSGGLTPGESDEEFDPVAAAHAAKKRRY